MKYRERMSKTKRGRLYFTKTKNSPDQEPGKNILGKRKKKGKLHRLHPGLGGGTRHERKGNNLEKQNRPPVVPKPQKKNANCRKKMKYTFGGPQKKKQKRKRSTPKERKKSKSLEPRLSTVYHP